MQLYVGFDIMGICELSDFGKGNSKLKWVELHSVSSHFAIMSIESKTKGIDAFGAKWMFNRK